MIKLKIKNTNLNLKCNFEIWLSDNQKSGYKQKESQIIRISDNLFLATQNYTQKPRHYDNQLIITYQADYQKSC
jgi:hypothetical protein